MATDPKLTEIDYSTASVRLAEALEKLYRAGGLALVFLFIGTVLVIFGNVAPGISHSGTTVGVGVLLLVGSFCIFAFLQLRGPGRAIRTLRENQATIDALQELSVELVGSTFAVQAFVLRYANEIADVTRVALPILKRIPVVSGRVREWKLDQVPHLCERAIAVTTDAEVAIKELERALRNADFTLLKRYAGSLVSLKEQMRKLTSGLTVRSRPPRQKLR
jgi:hypothetical protein